MPELPEVETVVRTLRKILVGKEINKVVVRRDKLVKTSTPATFKKKLKGQKILKMERVGKHILFILDDYVLVSHLRMEGKYYVFNNEKDVEVGRKHVMAELHFTDGSLAFYNDTRQFGTMHLLPKEGFMEMPPLGKVGPEPWDPACTAEYLHNRIKKKTQAIKATLLDQTIMAGLGNIYVDEVLFRMKMSPTKPSGKLTKKQCQQVIDTSKEVMEFAIKLGGTSINSYTSSLGVDGKFQNELKVHTKKDEECPVCKTIIKKTRVGGRGTYYCPKCQK